MWAPRVLTTAGTRCTSPLFRSLVLRSLSIKSGNKLPSHPFEIDLNPLVSSSTLDTLNIIDPKRPLALENAETTQHELNLLNDEMSALFGEQVAKYGQDETLSTVFENSKTTIRREKTLLKEDQTCTGDAVDIEQNEQCSMLHGELKMMKKMKRQRISEEKITGRDTILPVDVLLLQGPCSFVRGVWTSGDVKKEELLQRVQAHADHLKIGMKSYNYDSEKMVLEKILEARENQVIVLCWNISLSKSPFIVHALEHVQSNAIIVSPGNIEHGPLPANVVGVLSGFGDQSLSLALIAAANLCGLDTRKD
ncbi:unnamed protein product [Peronospora belbahrii]|uniref:3-dehydroquinate dehydratase n=1 Tax=Peronospora belbahrii TaxID=622444 RepID=A0ABN8CJH3_9STRA|nr:unnamed protein product [Peronospora belbahrii]